MTTPAKVRAAARHAHELGFTVLPIRGKRPHFGALQAALGHARWSELRGRPWEEVAPCFDERRQKGFQGAQVVQGWAIEWDELHGCLDFDDRAVWEAFRKRCREAGLGKLLERCLAGYSVRTPRGMRFAVRCEAGLRSGPLAYRWTGEKDERGRPRKAEIIGLKGRGGYTVEAPSYGDAHPSGKRYGPQRGRLETIARLETREVQALLDVAVTLDETGSVTRAEASPPARVVSDDGSGRVTAAHRWHERLPCPICGGAQRKGGDRPHCYGYQHPRMPLVVYCTETPYEGARQTDIGGYLHRVGGRCPCGDYHGERVMLDVVEETDDEGNVVSERTIELREDLRALRHFEEVGLTFVVGDQNRLVWREPHHGSVLRQSMQAAAEAFRGLTVQVVNVEEDDEGGLTAGLERVPALKHWLSRVTDDETAYGYCYTDAVPHFHVHKGRLNLWRGEVCPEVDHPEAVERFLAHLERMCGGRKSVARYVLDSVGWHIQNPTRRSEVATFLYGLPGTGKNTVTYGLSKLWHPQHSVELHDDAILQAGGFNAVSDGVSLLTLDEAVFLKSPRDMNKLKTLITAPERVINAKYQPEYRIENMLTIFLLSNCGEIRLDSADRRYLVLEMDPTLANDHAWFDALYAEIEAPHFGGALLSWGRRRKLPAGWTPQRALKDLHHEEQELAREAGLTLQAKWTRALLRGEVVGWTAGERIVWDDLHGRVAQWVAQQGVEREVLRRETHPQRFSRSLRQMLGWDVLEVGRSKRRRQRVVVPKTERDSEARWVSVTGVPARL